MVEKNDPGLIIKGGLIDGEVPLSLDWTEAYVNSAGVVARDHAEGEIHDWIINQAWDGIRLSGDSDEFLINEVWMSDIRDDVIENDDGSGGAITNSLFDGGVLRHQPRRQRHTIERCRELGGSRWSPH